MVSRTILPVLGFALAAAFPKPPVIIPAQNPHDPPELPSGVHKSVLVVGGGVAGLSAAFELAERGYKVVLKEKGHVLGGRLSTEAVTLPGVGTFNVEVGFHSWFHNYWQFADIRQRLSIDGNFQPWATANYMYRHYKPETIYSKGPYPLNMLGVIERSPNLNMMDAIKSQKAMHDMTYFDYDTIYQKYDNMSFYQWADFSGINRDLFNVFLKPIVMTTINVKEHVSAAYMFVLQQLCFLSDPKADLRTVPNKPWNRAVIDPWARRLKALGVDIRLGTGVRSLRTRDGVVLGDEVDDYDAVILASDLKGVQAILSNSSASDAASKQALRSMLSPVGQLPTAPPFKIMRVWFDGKLNPDRPKVLESDDYFPICLIVQYHLLEDESAEWANRTGGSVVEFHLYTYNATALDAPDHQVWEAVRPTILEMYAEVGKLKVLGLHVGTHSTMTAWSRNTYAIRPNSTFPQRSGLSNLAFAGDWLHTAYPSAFMERAVSTGREAANAVLLRDHVRQVPLKVTSSKGPGEL